MKAFATAVTICAAATVLAGCAGDPQTGSNADSTTGGGEVVDGGTFTMAMSTDPGNLDPQGSAGSALFQISQFAYDGLVAVDPDNGTIQSALASDWKVAGKKVTLTMTDGVTCSDGSKFTATTAADNINYVADPANKSEFLGVYLPVGAKATADNGAGTLQIKLAAPSPFVLNGLANLPMVCGPAVKDRTLLKDKTLGTGPYELTDAVPSDHYTYTIRDGYTWGPDGIGTDTEGLPDTVVVKVVQNETTSANLLLSDAINASMIIGPDVQRLEKAGLFSTESLGLLGEQWYNQAEERPTSDPAVRMALTQGVDLEQLRKVLTSGRGAPATTLATSEPAACPGDSTSKSLPAYDVDQANQLLDDAGWAKGSDGVRTKDGKELSLTFIYDTSLGSGGSAAAEIAAQQWEDLGAIVTTKGQTGAATEQTLFASGDWDISWIPLNVSSPDQLVPFLSGTEAPDGTNFAHIDNPTYEAGVAKASKILGQEGCDEWLKAESALIADAEIVPFANNVVKYFGNKAEFDTAGLIIPTSIRMLAS